jgi:hypothetical protein
VSVTLDSLFGERSWEDVRAKVHARLRDKWDRKSVQNEDIEDAVSDALGLLMSAWLSYPSTQRVIESGDTAKTFAYAVKWAEWKANRVVSGLVYDEDAHLGLSELTDDQYQALVGRLIAKHGARIDAEIEAEAKSKWRYRAHSVE